MLGYFSLIGLLRVHVLLGDYTLALKMMENVELNQKVYNNHLPEARSPLLKPRLVAFHPRHCMPCYNLLLCWVLLHYAAAISRRHPHLCHHPEFHHAHEAVPHSQLPIRSGQFTRNPKIARKFSKAVHPSLQISKTADRMYALFAVCHALSPSRLDDNIANIAKERFGEQYAKMARGG